MRKINGAILACWRQATLNGWVTANPWRGQRLPKVPASAGEVLTTEQVTALRAACEPGLEAMWIDVHLATGARPGEVVGLRWSTIDLDQLVLNFVDTKHGGRTRSVAITPATVTAIRGWQIEQRSRALAYGAGLDPDPWLFTLEWDASRPWTVNYAGSFRWPRLRERAGLPTELRLYDLRHTHNSWLDAAGIDATTRAARIGNSPATNQRVYSHPTRDRDAAAAVAGRLG